ncbi:autophagy protein 16, interacts with Atg12p-Atg5p [Coniosporium tulheliwenetii]|uniref:Autophagy protein 16, interacts with Atg12p-Atg5p n=1 Tax=Coniosporium tulheliwenetii TaxID=3383036 RepID=A0ACC2YTT9_9PEZI|nr:autophagy protein 16, interacts with Atg12p-Atg5p [Cladosporium sp. JES 115]
MSSWLAEYSASLDLRDAREKAQIAYINAYTKLADRTAAAEARAAQAPSAVPSSPLPASAASPSTPLIGKSSPRGKQEDRSSSPGDALSRLRADLASTQRSRAELQAKLAPLTSELETLKKQSTLSDKRIAELTREKVALERKLRDRYEETKGKSKLVEEVQDEMVSLNLQLNMAEQRAEKLEGRTGSWLSGGWLGWGRRQRR